MCTEVDEPYEAMVILCKRPLFYSAIVLSLNSLYREELPIITGIRRRFSHVDIWLSDTDGRQAALAEGMRLGADGLFADDDLHRVSGDAHPPRASASAGALTAGTGESPAHKEQTSTSEKSADPLLTAEELRALLEESSTPNPG
jgi:hypothetical protein